MKKNTNSILLCTRPNKGFIVLPPQRPARPNPIEIIRDWMADARADIAVINKHFNAKPA